MLPARLPIHLLLVVGVLAGAFALRVWDPAPVARLRLAAFDSFLVAHPRTPDPDFPVRIVDIDEASLQKLGQWPWPRTRMAELIERLSGSGARTIAIDLVLAEPDRLSPAALAETVAGIADLKPLAERASSLPSNDVRLANVISKAPVVLGFSAETGPQRQLSPPRAAFALAGDDPKVAVPRFEGGTGPLPLLAEAAQGLGAVNWLPEHDQIVRHVPLLVSAAGKLYPALSLEALRISEGPRSTILVKSSNASGVSAFGAVTGVETIRVGPHILPSDGRGELWLNFAPPDARRYIPAHELLAGAIPRSEIEGRHILIGASATGLLDLRATPLAPSVAGVEIHAQALEQMLSGQHLIRPAWATGAELTFILVAAAAVAWLIGRSGALVAAGASIAAILAVLGASWFLFRDSGLLIDPVYPALTVVAVYLTGSLANFVKAETERSRIRRAFGHYVAPAIVAELAREPARLKLGGETREITLLFADVRGFSRLSEGMDATSLVSFINWLFTPLADVILARRGTIDKFMGDAVMAFWNAPLPDPLHASEACRAALEMQAAIVAANAERAGGLPPIRIGIGVNTGPCVVGNVGSPSRFDYSVLGDVVNTAARIEEATKSYGVPIIVGEETAAAAPDFAFVEIGQVTLRGKEFPVRLYALTGDEGSAYHPEFRNFRTEFAAFAAAMTTGDKAARRHHLAQCRALAIPGTEAVLAAAEHRIDD